MEATIIRNIIAGYENQLLNAEIQNDQKKACWLREQINEGKIALAKNGVYNLCSR